MVSNKTDQTKSIQIKNVRPNKAFLARFENSNLSNKSVDNSNISNNEDEQPITIKYLNELPKTKVINNKIKNSPLTTPNRNQSTRSSQSQNDEISIISHHSSSTNDELAISKSNIEVIKETENVNVDKTNHQTPIDIVTVYGDETSKNIHNGDNDAVYYQETQVK